MTSEPSPHSPDPSERPLLDDEELDTVTGGTAATYGCAETEGCNTTPPFCGTYTVVNC